MIRFSVLTVESDDPAVIGLVRELLEHAGAGAGVLVVPQAAARASTPAAETKAPEPETKAPPVETAYPDLRSAARDLGRRGGVKGGHARAAALSSEERSAAAKAAADKRWGNEQTEKAAEPPATPPAPIIWEPPATPSAQAGTHGTRRVERAIANIVEREKQSSTEPDGGTRALEPAAPAAVAPAPAPLPVTGADSRFLGERIMRAVTAQAGTSVPMLAQLLLGGSDQAKIRQIEMGLQPLVMRSEVYRANGRVFPSVKSAAAAPAPAKPGPKPTAEPDQRELYDKLIAAYAKRNDAPATELARLLFGEPTGITIAKVKLMTKQLCASERLKRTAWDSFRPWDEKKDRDEDASDESDDEDDADDADGDDKGETDLESNGHPDDEEPQELDVG